MKIGYLNLSSCLLFRHGLLSRTFPKVDSGPRGPIMSPPHESRPPRGKSVSRRGSRMTARRLPKRSLTLIVVPAGGDKLSIRLLASHKRTTSIPLRGGGCAKFVLHRRCRRGEAIVFAAVCISEHGLVCMCVSGARLQPII